MISITYLGYNPVRLGETVQAIGAAERVAEARQREFTPLFPSYRSTMADLLGLRYIAIDRPMRIRQEAQARRFQAPGPYVRRLYLQNPRALPRVMLLELQAGRLRQARCRSPVARIRPPKRCS